MQVIDEIDITQLPEDQQEAAQLQAAKAYLTQNAVAFSTVTRMWGPNYADAMTIYRHWPQPIAYMFHKIVNGMDKNYSTAAFDLEKAHPDFQAQFIEAVDYLRDQNILLFTGDFYIFNPNFVVPLKYKKTLKLWNKHCEKTQKEESHPELVKSSKSLADNVKKYLDSIRPNNDG